MSGHTISDDSDLRRYRTELPNLIDDLGLSPFAYRLYGHYKRVCGAAGGKCWQSTKTIAAACKMSVGSVSKAKRELQAKRELLARGLIEIEPGRGDGSDRVTIVDIWLQNMARYTPERSSGERSRSCGERSRSPGETKKELSEEGTKEEISPPHAHAACVSEDLMTDTKKFICSLFPRRMRLSKSGERALKHWAPDLPLSHEDKRRLKWFYGLANDPHDLDLRSRYRNAERLAENLFSAIENAEAYEKRGGRRGP